MDQYQALKQQIYQHLQELLDNKITEINSLIESAKDARDSDNKSSSGDKFETGRAMMQIEMENLNNQLNTTEILQQTLSRINPNVNLKNVEFGSLVITSSGNYFISIGLGKVLINGIPHYAISIVSPIGQVLANKTAGDKITFNGRLLEIKAIV